MSGKTGSKISPDLNDDASRQGVMLTCLRPMVFRFDQSMESAHSYLNPTSKGKVPNVSLVYC
ncbi:uncharacterized protein N7482_003400 [Penicillium canariense]|uniref:Uncharacterized protein n=1 Tax=Penicillium canariense TaxID=189055 RepID=A0A9W9I6A4_9EURO|nr:uncharacterized protein N7482_003400 [Penicillium canariense]KAJ5167806.1 hypothetical protein N7482_003400 [Penicillium canariense]